MNDEEIKSRLNSLFKDWKEKAVHKGEVFISDGIVDESKWHAEDNKKILFVLKEAYGGDENWSLTDWLSSLDEYPKIWKRVIEWTYGIHYTTETHIEAYSPYIYDKNKGLIKNIAVLNLKKSRGKPRSNYEDIRKYARDDRSEIQEQIKIISPDIIVCGSTFSILNEEVYDNKICSGDSDKCDNWFYYTNELTGKNTLVIDYYHPAVQWAALANYYAIVNIHQQALLKNSLERGMIENGKA